MLIGLCMYDEYLNYSSFKETATIYQSERPKSESNLSISLKVQFILLDSHMAGSVCLLVAHARALLLSEI